MNPAFVLKSYTLNTLVLTLQHTDAASFSLQLQQQKKKAPELLKDIAVLLDITPVQQALTAEQLNVLIPLLNQANLPVIGILNTHQTALSLATAVGLPCLIKRASKLSAPPEPINQIIHGPVRSGQQIVADKGDLIIVGTVSAGAELLAPGNIHIYGSLRGKALAGTQGDENCHIFCQNFAAELVAIAGDYQLTQSMPASSLQTGPLMINKQAGKLTYHALSPQGSPCTP